MLFTLTMLIPIGVALVNSLTAVRREGAFGEKGVHTVFAGLDNYALALGNEAFTQSFGRMLLFGVIQVPFMLGLALLLALLLEKLSARWQGLFRSAYFLPYGIPGIIASILWAFLYVPGLSPLIDVAQFVGLELDFFAPKTVLWSIANIVTWSYTGYNMLILVAQLKSIPSEIYEAARLDGASAWRIARSIQIPLLKPALLLTAVFSVIGTLQLFAEPQLIATMAPSVDSQYTPNLSAYTMAFGYSEYNVAAAQSILIALVAFVLSVGVMAATSRKGK
jgi:multiple sugar transport system permease protein